ncbi:hypothetical protein C8034_v008122 [Colletotrichum sidae]|nr:hypothetical protein C8034_v008122 [Colletotrichum sidae]
MVKIAFLTFITPVLATTFVTLKSAGNKDGSGANAFAAWADRTCKQDLKGLPYSSSNVDFTFTLNCANIPASWCSSYPGGKTYHPFSTFNNPVAGKCYEA